MKSYNINSLRGQSYDDHQFKQDLMEHSNINIPDHLLYTPAINDYVLNETHRQNAQNLQEIVNPKTSAKYTPDEAFAEATSLRDVARENINRYMR